MGAGELPVQTAIRPVRCAIYTRKSTEEGLMQEFNSLDAQREYCQAYIHSQRQEGWALLPQHYDDGGYTGANLNRPALKQLLTDIEEHGIDCVVIYKVDRLSRSLFDFARLMQTFQKHEVSFVSVTQQLNSSTPMGRLTLNVLLSFAEFERELVSERTRDKVSAARRKGKWTGGCPVLGYDPDPSGTHLVVNEAEAGQVREIFATFLRHGSLVPTLEEIDQRDWRMKSWTKRNGENHVGGAFDRAALMRLLSNPLYTGAVKHHGQMYPGEQPAIVEPKVWKRVNDLLRVGSRGSEQIPRNRQGALLKDLMECAVCGRRMVPGYTQKKGQRYRYYVCLTAQKRGASACPGQIVAAHRIEPAVVQRLQDLAREPGWEALRVAVEADFARWHSLEPAEQHRILRAILEGVCYDGRNEQGTLQLGAAWGANGEAAVIALPLKARAVVEQIPPAAKPLPTLSGRLPRITRLMALAVRFEQLLRDATVENHADLARLGGVSRARVTQILNLRNLAPAIQEELLFLPAGSRVGHVPERELRRLTGTPDWGRQMVLFAKLTQRPMGQRD